MRVSRLSLILYLRVRFTQQALDSRQSPLELRHPARQVVEGFAVGRASVANGLGEPRRCLLASPGHLLPSHLAAADDVVQQALRSLSRLGRRVGGRSEGALDGRAKRVANPLGLLGRTFRGARGIR